MLHAVAIRRRVRAGNSRDVESWEACRSSDISICATNDRGGRYLGHGIPTERAVQLQLSYLLRPFVRTSDTGPTTRRQFANPPIWHVPTSVYMYDTAPALRLTMIVTLSS